MTERSRLLQIRDNYNLSSMFSEIRNCGPIAKSKVGLSLSISKPTRYSLINSLLEAGLIVELAAGNGGKSSRSSLLDVRGNLFFTVGVDIHLAGVDVVLMDQKFAVRDAVFLPNNIDTAKNVSLDDRDTILERIKGGIAGILDENSLQTEDLLSIGISDFGMIDAKEGISLFTPHFPGWSEVPLRSIVQRFFAVPIYLGRDANLMTIAEIYANNLAHYGDILCIGLRRGIGFGIFINGQLYTGFSGNAGELSHTSISQTGKRCVCGKTGCLDTQIGYYALMQRVAEFYHSESGTALHSLARSEADLTLEALFKAYEKDKGEIRSMLAFFIETLAKEIANLFYLFDPYLLILTGRFVDCGECFLADLQAQTESHFPAALHRRIRLRKGTLGTKAASWGAAFMAQEMILHPDHLDIVKKQEKRTVSSLVSQSINV